MTKRAMRQHHSHPEPPEACSRTAAERRRTVEGPPYWNPDRAGAAAYFPPPARVSAGGPSASYAAPPAATRLRRPQDDSEFEKRTLFNPDAPLVSLPARETHAGGVADISRWQAPKARSHRTQSSFPSDPGRGRGRRSGTPAGVRILGGSHPVAARLRRLPPANFPNASGVVIAD
jgi:hypothetical protein